MFDGFIFLYYVISSFILKIFFDVQANTTTTFSVSIVKLSFVARNCDVV